MSNKPMPRISEFMTRSPHSVASNVSVLDLLRKMRDGEYRHLPVTKDGRVVGIVSLRSAVAAAQGSRGTSLLAEDIMTPDPVTVSPRTGLDEVAAMMAEDKHGSVLVEEEGELVGIFTTVDASRALRQILEQAYPR